MKEYHALMVYTSTWLDYNSSSCNTIILSHKNLKCVLGNENVVLKIEIRTKWYLTNVFCIWKSPVGIENEY